MNSRKNRSLPLQQVATGKAAVLLERAANVWNWSDPAVTALATGVLGGACLAASFLLALVPPRALALAALTAFLLKPRPDDSVAEAAAAAAEAAAVEGGGESPAAAALKALLSRVPDDMVSETPTPVLLLIEATLSRDMAE